MHDFIRESVPELRVGEPLYHPPPEQQFRDWHRIGLCLDFRFQPIINVHTGHLFGCEASLVGVAQAGFASVAALFDAAVQDKVMADLDHQLRERAIRHFVCAPNVNRLKLFYKADNRLILMEDYIAGRTKKLLSDQHLSQDALYLEISECSDPTSAMHMQKALKTYREQGYRIVLDPFGSGHGQLRLLQQFDPEVIKIDQDFVSSMVEDRRNEQFVSHMVNMAHMVGAQVVAVGVETEKTYWACKRVGCDMVQGSFVQDPIFDLSGLNEYVPHIATLSRRARRQEEGDKQAIFESLQKADPLTITGPAISVIDFFQRHANLTVAPVVDAQAHPVGFIREADFKEFSYTPFGRELLQNPSSKSKLKDFVKRCPVADISIRLDELIETFANTGAIDGIILTEDGRYQGFLDEKALLAAIYERNTVNARDQNPLTHLPGNSAIFRFVSAALIEPRQQRFLVYFDFDNFKPFNDLYGFRQGDRAILLFSELLGASLSQVTWFVGHVGGDDFIAYAQSMDYEKIFEQVDTLCDVFARRISSFYEAEAREQGFILGKDRGGTLTEIPLMTVSAAIIQIPPQDTAFTFDDIVPFAAEMKAIAKRQTDPVVAAGIYRKI